MSASRAGVVLVGLAFLAPLCVLAVPVKQPDKKAGGEEFHTRLKQIAGEYLTYGRIDDEYRWAPYLCRMPNPGKPAFSESKDGATHGQKLYSLFVKHRRYYPGIKSGIEAPEMRREDRRGHVPVINNVGQVIVKESWVPEEVKGKQKADIIVSRVEVKEDQKADIVTRKGRLEDHFSPFATRDGKRYHASKKAALFIMFKLDPTTPNTDKGWVYGTVSPDGKEVTSAGRVESCMKCHQTKEDRLFGLVQQGIGKK